MAQQQSRQNPDQQKQRQGKRTPEQQRQQDALRRGDGGSDKPQRGERDESGDDTSLD